MDTKIDLRGASGAVYRFRLADDGSAKTTISGNFVYVRATDGDPVVLFLGQTDNLMLGVSVRWPEAVSDHGATHLFTRLNVAGAARGAELEDLLAALHPVMNQEEKEKKKRPS